MTSLMAQGPGEARHDIAVAPGATTGSVLCFILELRADGPVHPLKPRNPTGVCNSIEFWFFPGPQKHKDPKGSRVAYTYGVSGGLGLRVKDLHQ